MGMTWEQYWQGDVTMVRAYAEAERLRQQKWQQKQNFAAWQQGMYIYDTLLRVAPILQAFAAKGAKPEPYVPEPYKFADDSKEEQPQISQEEYERLQAKVYMQNMAQAGKSWGK